MKVKDAMHEGVVWVGPDTPIFEVAQKMRENDIGALPIGENDRLIGMVTDRDLTCRALANGQNIADMTARSVMTQGIIYCRDSEEIEDALRIMENNRIRRLPVIDTNKRMVGMLSLGDISHCVPYELSGEVVAAVSAHHQ